MVFSLRAELHPLMHSRPRELGISSPDIIALTIAIENRMTCRPMGRRMPAGEEAIALLTNADVAVR